MKTPIDHVTLLDCTLRDGGYYNEWDFGSALIERYLAGMASASVPVLEVGFRFPKTNRFLGATAYSSDRYLEQLELPQHALIGVMANAKDLLSHNDGPSLAVDALFAPAEASPVQLVRIASTPEELADLGPAVLRLRELGYRVGINIMQVHRVSHGALEEFGRSARSWGCDVAYFGDSFGVVVPDQVRGLVEAVGTGFEGPVGCHFHDNRALAMGNVLAAVDAGASWIDGTLLGMGRGPGNPRTEYVAAELNSRGLSHADPKPLVGLVSEEFVPLQREHEWGTNICYYMSAAHAVHPTYVQSMLGDARYSTEQIVGVIERLGDEGRAFSAERVDRLVEAPEQSNATGSWDVSGRFEGADVLILGPGPAGQNRRRDLESFIAETKPVVFGLNLHPPVDADIVDYLVACNPDRIAVDMESLPSLPCPLIAPGDLLPSDLKMGSTVVCDYGLELEEQRVEGGALGCVLPSPLAAGYAIALAWSGGARRILLSGFDGFDQGDPRQSEMEGLFRLFLDADDAPSIVAVTPTRYSIDRSSLYAEWM